MEKAINGIIHRLRMVPAITLVLPMFLLLKNAKSIDNYLGVIICYVAFNLPFAIWLTTGYFRDLPKELVQAAQIDGCNHLRIFTGIFIPLSAPGLSAMASLVFFGAWNDFLIAITLTRMNTRTLPVIISSYITEQTIVWNELAAVATIVSLPAIILTLLLQNILCQV